MTTLGGGIAALMQDAAINRAFARQEEEAIRNANDWKRHCDKIQNEWRKHCKGIEQDRDALLTRLWSELGEKGALHGALRRVAPIHPLTMTQLEREHRDKAGAAGVAAGKSDPRNFAAAFRAGLDLQPPPSTLMSERFHVRSPAAEIEIKDLQSQVSAKSAEVAALRARVADLESAQKRSSDAKAAISAKLKEQDAQIEEERIEFAKGIKEFVGHMALHYAYRLALTQSDPAHVTLQDPGAAAYVVRKAYKALTRNLPQLDWEAVRVVGESWAMPQSVSAAAGGPGGFSAGSSPQEEYEDLVNAVRAENARPDDGGQTA